MPQSTFITEIQLEWSIILSNLLNNVYLKSSQIPRNTFLIIFHTTNNRQFNLGAAVMQIFPLSILQTTSLISRVNSIAKQISLSIKEKEEWSR